MEQSALLGSLILVVNKNELGSVEGVMSFASVMIIKNVQCNSWQLHHCSPVQCVGYNYRILVNRIGLKEWFSLIAQRELFS